MIVLLLVACPTWADEAHGLLDFHYTGSRLDDGDTLEHDRSSVYGELTLPLLSADGGNVTASAKGAVLGLVDHVEPHRALGFRELYIDVLAGNFSVRAGLQDVPWSETFGFFIADLVNPRDLRDALYTDPRYARRPVAALKTQWSSGPITAQAVLTPVTRNTLFSSAPIDGVAVLPEPSIRVADYPHDLEVGGRVEALLFDKLDSAVFALRHRSRTFAAESVQTNEGAALQEVSTMVDSYGLTSSYALESVVFREDMVYTPRQPVSATDFGPVQQRDELQSILGCDYSTTDDFTLGLQYQFETHGRPFHWVSARVSKKFSGSGLQPELFIFRGIGNHDVWVEPQLTWYANNRLTASLRYDAVAAGAQVNGDFIGYLPTLRHDDRVLAELDYRL